MGMFNMHSFEEEERNAEHYEKLNEVIAERDRLKEELKREKDKLDRFINESIKQAQEADKDITKLEREKAEAVRIAVEKVQNIDRYSPDFGYYAGSHQKAWMEVDSTGDYVKYEDLAALVESLTGKPWSEVGR